MFSNEKVQGNALVVGIICCKDQGSSIPIIHLQGLAILTFCVLKALSKMQWSSMWGAFEVYNQTFLKSFNHVHMHILIRGGIEKVSWGGGGGRILFEFTKYINTNIRFHILVVG
jgi:hypothetical protein